MKTYTQEEFNEMAFVASDSTQTSENGHILIYTHLYRHKDGSIKDVPDPNWNVEDAFELIRKKPVGDGSSVKLTFGPWFDPLDLLY